MHDCRTRTLEEAILWHDGKAKNVKQKFMQSNNSDSLWMDVSNTIYIKNDAGTVFSGSVFLANEFDR